MLTWSRIILILTGLLTATVSFGQPGKAGSAAALLKRATQQADSGKYNDAAQTYAAAIKSDSTNADAHYGLARVLVYLARPDLAFRAVTTSLRYDSTRAAAWAFRGALAGQYYSKIGALQDYTRALNLTPDNADFRLARAMVFQDRNQWQESKSDLDLLLARHADNANARIARAQSLLALGEYPAALADLDAVLQANPNQSQAQFLIGSVKAAQRDYEGAIAAYTEAIKLDPAYAGAYYTRANLRFEAQNYEAARADLDSALRHNPVFLDAYNLRAQVHLNRKDYDACIADCNVILENRTSSAVLATRGNALYNQKKYMEALVDLDAAIKLDASNGTAFLMRGLIRLQLELKSTACQDFTRARELGILQAEGMVRRYCGTGTPPPANSDAAKPASKPAGKGKAAGKSKR